MKEKVYFTVQEKQPMMWYHRSITGRTIEEYL